MSGDGGAGGGSRRALLHGTSPKCEAVCSHIEGFPTGLCLGPGSHFKGTILLPEHLDIAH